MSGFVTEDTVKNCGNRINTYKTLCRDDQSVALLCYMGFAV